MGGANEEDDAIRRRSPCALAGRITTLTVRHRRFPSPLKGGWSILGAGPSGLIAPSDLASVAALPTNSPSPHAPTFRQNWRGHRADHRCGLRAVADLYHVLRDRTGRPKDRTDRRRDVRRGAGKLSPAPPRGRIVWITASLAAPASKFRGSASAP